MGSTWVDEDFPCIFLLLWTRMVKARHDTVATMGTLRPRFSCWLMDGLFVYPEEITVGLMGRSRISNTISVSSTRIRCCNL